MSIALNQRVPKTFADAYKHPLQKTRQHNSLALIFKPAIEKHKTSVLMGVVYCFKVVFVKEIQYFR